MARLMPERNALIVRLVYDGPPLSGKTTSLGALAEGSVPPQAAPVPSVATAAR